MAKPNFSKKGRGKRRIDQVRDRGGRAQIAAEHGNIVCMTTIAGRIYLIARQGVVSGEMADSIDPDRTNIAIPPFVQRTELAYGSDHPIIRKTLCVARALLDPTYLSADFNDEDARAYALEVAVDLAAVQDVVNELQANQKLIEVQLKTGELAAGYLPRTANLRGKIHGCIAHLKNVETSISKLTQLFHPKNAHNDQWQKAFNDSFSLKFEDGSEEARQMNKMLLLLKVVTSHRNAMIHPDNSKSVIVHDYSLMPSGALAAPSVEIRHPEFGVERVDAIQFFSAQLTKLSDLFEAWLAVICNLNVRDMGMLESHVAQLPVGEEQFGSQLVWQTVPKAEFATRFAEAEIHTLKRGSKGPIT